jgi:uncharacterized RDD family membrane protein YckC
MLVTLVIGWVIWSFVVWGRGQTPAKQLLNMRVVKRDRGRPCTWAEMLLREFVLCGLLSVITAHLFKIVGMFFVFSEDRRALWDRMIDTMVVDE